MKRLSINSQNSKSGSSIDSNLSEAASGSGSSNKNKSDQEVMPVEHSLTKTKIVQSRKRRPSSQPDVELLQGISWQSEQSET